MRLSRTLSLVAAVLQISALHGQALKTGPGVGEHVPDFSAPDQANHSRTLQSILGPKGAMLVFFRSADW